MWSPRITGLISFCFLLSCRVVLGTDPSESTEPNGPPPNLITTSPNLAPLPGTVGASDIGNPASTPSMMALPAQTSTTGSNGPIFDAGNIHKFYTFSVDLRETYDDNVNTTSGASKQSSLETSLSPSVLVSFPMENTSLSAGYTFGATYYTQTGGTGDNLQYSHQFNAQFNHAFSGRFSINAGDSLVDSPEPNIYGTTGTPYRDGQNISNSFSSGFSAQWTPLIGTQTTYANTIVRYLNNPSVAASEDSMENTGSQSVSFTVVPNISVSCGGIFDTIDYDQNPRGYTSFSGFLGGNWQALPNVTTSLRCGGSYTETQQLNGSQTSSTSSVSPYIDASGSWQIGERSSLSADYSHEITPSDYAGSNAQESDRVSGSFNYLVSPQLTTHFQVSYTSSNTSGSNIYLASSTSSYTQTVYEADAGASYNFIKYFSLTFDITESGVSTGLPDQDYNREQVSIGVRGTY